jgi:hypothetical protein
MPTPARRAISAIDTSASPSANAARRGQELAAVALGVGAPRRYSGRLGGLGHLKWRAYPLQ